jgi:hypothetical protein
MSLSDLKFKIDFGGEPMKCGLNYVAISDSKTNELLGAVFFKSEEIIQKNNVKIHLGYGEPTFTDIDGKIYINTEEK